MKNTTITNKYLLAVGVLLLIAVFAVAKPISAFAQDAGDDGSGSIDIGSDPTDIGSDPVDIGSDPTDIGSDPVVVDPGYGTTYVSGGTYYGGSYAYPGTSYYYGGSAGPSVSGSTVYVAAPVYYSAPATTVTGTSISEPVVYEGATGYYPTTSGYDYGNLTGSCSGSTINGGTTNTVTWTGLASGGNGIYTYYWSGTNGLSGTGQYISQTYPISGVESADLSITSSDGETYTATCSVMVGSPNQVLAYSATNPNLQSVYLSNIPATGAGSVARVVGFISMLMLWSAALAYMFLKRNEKMENPIVASVATSDALESNDIQNFSMEMNSDEKAIASIETYARMNKVLLSSDAVKELAKLSRLGKVRPMNAIKKMSGTEWTTVGENDLEKYL